MQNWPQTGFEEVGWICIDKSALRQKSGSGGLTENISDARVPFLISTKSPYGPSGC
jgi:hypothetical protein